MARIRTTVVLPAPFGPSNPSTDPTGTVYPALHRLERAGLIAGTWSVVDGRRRRSYRLTAKGQRRLVKERTNWREFAAAVTSLLERTPWPATT